jgi:hypothetical protein
MLKIQVNLSPNSSNPKDNFGGIYEGCTISEAAGRFTIDDPQTAIEKVFNNLTALQYGIANSMVKIDGYELTGGAPVWAYLSACNALIGEKLTYSDGRQLSGLLIQILGFQNETQAEEQIIDLSIKTEHIDDGLIIDGYFKGLKASVAGGRVSLDSSPAEVFEVLQNTIKIESSSVSLTGAMPIWIYLCVARSLLAQDIKVKYNDGRGGEFKINK